VPNCFSNPSAVVPCGTAINPALAMIASTGRAAPSSASAQARTPRNDARSSCISSKLPFPPVSSKIRAAALCALSRSRAAPTTSAPCATNTRAVSKPMPAETPVTKTCRPRRSTPSRTSSAVVVEPYRVAMSCLTVGSTARSLRDLICTYSARRSQSCDPHQTLVVQFSPDTQSKNRIGTHHPSPGTKEPVIAGRGAEGDRAPDALIGRAGSRSVRS